MKTPLSFNGRVPAFGLILQLRRHRNSTSKKGKSQISAQFSENYIVK
jgi:hypothetical protein